MPLSIRRGRLGNPASRFPRRWRPERQPRLRQSRGLSWCWRPSPTVHGAVNWDDCPKGRGAAPVTRGRGPAAVATGGRVGKGWVAEFSALACSTVVVQGPPRAASASQPSAASHFRMPSVSERRKYSGSARAKQFCHAYCETNAYGRPRLAWRRRLVAAAGPRAPATDGAPPELVDRAAEHRQALGVVARPASRAGRRSAPSSGRYVPPMTMCRWSSATSRAHRTCDFMRTSATVPSRALSASRIWTWSCQALARLSSE
jgi:hypothetical protein